MGCFNKKKQHVGDLETLATFPTGWTGETDAVVRWCPKCGAVVIDKEYDGRLANYYVKMRFPDIIKKTLKQKTKPQQGIYKSLWEEEWTIK